ncbi:MAG: replication-associated recombination protein A [Deltaproteobacteria bacterium]|nr:replication-associated recombination protein A [Deltaproteobacteria bacterium]
MARRPRFDPYSEPHAPGLFDEIEPAPEAPRSGGAASGPGAERRADAPLADRVRPSRLEEVAGQPELLGEGKPLAEAIRGDELPSMILWGPPGSGKTTLAHVLASSTRARFVALSAVLGGVAEVRRIVQEARARRRDGLRTVLFVDEIHRFNRAQQDAFLPHVEDGTIVLVGATTENPSFAVNAPLLSRCVVYQLQPLSHEVIDGLLRRAIEHPAGVRLGAGFEDDALSAIAASAGGDARRALQFLELCARLAGQRNERLTRAWVEHVSTHRPLLYDKSGEEHYNVVSAFIKSMRGSDPDAAIYWMMRMLEAGDDPLFVLRRMLIFASEDVGNADPRALSVAVAADEAFRRLGMPEGIYPLAQACLYLASAPKSNASNVAWHRAREAVTEHGSLPVPLKLRNAPTALMKEQGCGEGYRYPHDEPGGVAEGEKYLPELLAGACFYEPTDRGYERNIGERLRWIRSGQK